jgi:hypothetical protein
MDKMAGERGKAWIGDHPGRFLALIPAKLKGLWLGDGETEWLYQMGYPGYKQHAGLFRALRIVNQIFYLGLLAAALASFPGLVRERAARPAWIFSGWALFGYFSVISAIFFGQSRFHFALMPFVILYAAHWLCRRILAITDLMRPPTS